jgi:pimeloyl-ACP methyl ester carboxylesterase
MKSGRLVTGLLAALAAGSLAPAPARAEPFVTDVRTVVVAKRKLAVTVDVSLGTRGTVSVVAEVNGRALRARKKLGPGPRTVRVTFDPRRARVRRADGPIVFDVTATVAEAGGVHEVRTLTASIGVPLVVLPGYGNEGGAGTFEGFAAALDAASGGAWGTGGKRPLAVLVSYPSQTEPLARLAKGVDGHVRRLLRGTPFRRVDVVGYSMGGLVARQWIAGAGRGRVRKLVLVAAPNEGIPTVGLLLFAARTGLLDALVAGATGGAGLGGLGLGDLLDPAAEESLGVFLPTYDWAYMTAGPVRIPLSSVLVPDEPPLGALNAVAPDPAIERIVAMNYTSVTPGGAGLPAGTIDEVDLTPFVSSGGGTTPSFDLSDPEALAALFAGSGDGLVPARSAWMEGVGSWSGSGRFSAVDLGAGTHLTYGSDARVVGAVTDVLTK